MIGDYDSICGFSALGMDIFPVDDPEEARRSLRQLAAGEYGVVYVTEQLIAAIPEEYERYQNVMTPAVVPIPSFVGEGGFAMETVRNYVKQAVGSDIIFNDNK